tara:strand:+ start:145 stop:312 length:168 start_codon:yes stop_codon:yes gene_type:complete
LLFLLPLQPITNGNKHTFQLFRLLKLIKKDGGIDWLHSISNPNGDDMGNKDFFLK